MEIISNMNKSIFLDRDGTLIEDKNYLKDEKEIVLLPNIIEGLKLLMEAGYLLFIVSNQSGVARGFFDEKTVIRINKYLKTLLLEKGIKIKEISYCPHLKGGIIKKYSIECNCRKPKTGMIDKLVKKYNIDLNKSYVIGDKISDMELANNCGCNYYLVLTGQSTIEDLKEVKNIRKDIKEIAKVIIDNRIL